MQKDNDKMAPLRQAIDRIDQEMIRLFAERMTVAQKIAAVKQESAAPVYVSWREKENIARAVLQLPAGQKSRAASFMAGLMRLSRSVQYEDLLAARVDFATGDLLRSRQEAWLQAGRVVVQGSAGSYSEKAANELFPHSSLAYAESFAAACQQVKAKSADVAVLPLENSTAGTVDDVYDLLLANELYIWRSLSLPIRHCLLGLPGADLAEIKTVVSHPQALAQCRQAISSQGWQLEQAHNTAFAAQLVARRQDRTWAALGSEAAGQAAGLVVLSSDVTDSGLNQTRFIAVGNELVLTPDARRISLILSLPHTSGALAAALAVFADHELNLSKIQSRPDRDNPWAYLFYLDFECSRAQLDQALTALYQLYCEMPQLRLLGWYGEVKAEPEEGL